MGLKTNTIPKDQLESVLQQLSDVHHIDFSCYKRSTVARSVEQRMRIRKCVTVHQYSGILQREAAETNALISALLIKATGFFRDPALWEALRHTVVPQLAARVGGSGDVRVWSVGCATGEEAYSIAMLLSELSVSQGFSFKVFATDRDADVIRTAGRGRFSHAQVCGLSPDLLERWFERDGDHYVVRRQLRSSVVFGVQDLIVDPPLPHHNLVLCRNLFIYLDTAGQRRALANLYQALERDCVMVLGKSELLPFGQGLFAAVDSPLRIYRKCAADPLEVFRSLQSRTAPVQKVERSAPSPDSGQEPVVAALNAIDCAVVVLDDQQVVKLWNEGATRMYGRPVSEVVGQPLSRVKLEGIAGERLLHLTSNKSGDRATEEIFSAGGSPSRTIRLKLRPFRGGAGEGGVICTAFDETQLHQATEKARRAEEREQEIEASYRDTIAELRSSYEELRAFNQDLRLANEQLQQNDLHSGAANQEREATNQELRLTGDQCQSLDRDPTPSDGEMITPQALRQALACGSEIAIVGVDHHGRVDFWSSGAARLFNWDGRIRRRSIEQLSLAPLPEKISRRIKQALSGKLALGAQVFDCLLEQDQIRLNCRLTALEDGARGPGTLLIIEPAHGLRRQSR